MDTLEILKAGRELISDPARWTQGAFARNETGESIFADEGAIRFCSIGAISKVCGKRCVSKFACEVLGGFNVALFNDTHTHAEVLAMWDRAIAAEEAKSSTHSGVTQ